MSEASELYRAVFRHPEVVPLVEELRRHHGGTYRHSLRVARLALRMGEGDGLQAGLLRDLVAASLLHDLGKARLDRSLVEKPAPLDEDERARMRQHPALGVEDLQALEAFPDAHRIAPLHHEQRGEASYPRSGRERRETSRDAADRRRPLTPALRRAGRILALADRYDALISRRAYKEAWDDEEARRHLRADMPDVADLLEHVPPPRASPG